VCVCVCVYVYIGDSEEEETMRSDSSDEALFWGFKYHGSRKAKPAHTSSLRPHTPVPQGRIQ
jgi:hypothetical protein